MPILFADDSMIEMLGYGFLAFFVLVLAPMTIHYGYKAWRAKQQIDAERELTELKREMVAAGMSAHEIQRVIAAGRQPQDELTAV